MPFEAETVQAQNSYVIIDFDSTFMQVEALEELAEIVLKDAADKDSIVEEIKNITSLGVDGKITFNDSLTRRLNLMKVHKSHLEKLVRRMKKKVSISFSRNKAFFKKNKGRIYIVSNGFKDFIDPIVKAYDIDPEFVLANTFLYDEEGWVTDFDQENFLAHSKGKSRTLKALGLEGKIMVIGDAYTDFEMVEAGIAHQFFAFTENVLRENILDKADHVTPSFDEFLYVNQMPRALSYPKNRIQVLLMDGVHEDAKSSFAIEGYELKTSKGAISDKDLAKKLKKVSILGVPPKTAITRSMLQNANRLMAICVFGNGTNNVDLGACADKGVIVFNAPYTNTRSVVELAIGHIIMLLRRIPVYNQRMKAGKWDRSGHTGFEIRGKKLGIIGYGHSGQQLSVLAEALGMDVLFYDLVEKPALGKAIKCHNLKDLLRKSDVVSINVDSRPENEAFFDRLAFNAMQEHSVLINLSNGQAVEIDALVDNLKSGKLLGAAVDVFQDSPFEETTDFKHELQQFENVILTPFIGGRTAEAQTETASFVPGKIIEYINTGNTAQSLNFPRLQLPKLKNAHRLIHIHENRPGLLARINSVLAKHRINILGQYLKTNDHIGYVITDINKKYSEEVLTDLKDIEHTIKFRVLY